jgi:hypothetical protein
MRWQPTFKAPEMVALLNQANDIITWISKAIPIIEKKQSSNSEPSKQSKNTLYPSLSVANPALYETPLVPRSEQEFDQQMRQALAESLQSNQLPPTSVGEAAVYVTMPYHSEQLYPSYPPPQPSTEMPLYYLPVQGNNVPYPTAPPALASYFQPVPLPSFPAQPQMQAPAPPKDILDELSQFVAANKPKEPVEDSYTRIMRELAGVAVMQPVVVNKSVADASAKEEKNVNTSDNPFGFVSHSSQGQLEVEPATAALLPIQRTL